MRQFLPTSIKDTGVPAAPQAGRTCPDACLVNFLAKLLRKSHSFTLPHAPMAGSPYDLGLRSMYHNRDRRLLPLPVRAAGSKPLPVTVAHDLLRQCPTYGQKIRGKPSADAV